MSVYDSYPTTYIFHQISALTPAAEGTKQFTKAYKSFATAVDTTRHELPVKNFYIDDDRLEFLGCWLVSELHHKYLTNTEKKLSLCASFSCRRVVWADSINVIIIHLYLCIFVDKAEGCLKESEKLLKECTEGDHEDNNAALKCLRDMKTTSKDISQQLSGCAQMSTSSLLQFEEVVNLVSQCFSVGFHCSVEWLLYKCLSLL